MLTLFRQALIFGPSFMGRSDVLVAGEKIAAVAPDLHSWTVGKELKVIEAGDFYLVPGLMDQHVHLVGGGGGAGFTSRGPELGADQAFLAGVTTVVGCLGVDHLGRSLEELLAKTRSLAAHGLTAKMYTGGFDWQDNITGNLRRDIYLLEPVIGVKVALADPRADQPDLHDLARIMVQSALAGNLSGKAGVIHVHLGDRGRGLDLLSRAVDKSGVDITRVVPTHVNRTEDLLAEARLWLKRGGRIDVSASFRPTRWRRAVKASEAVGWLRREGMSLERLTISTDGNSISTSDDARGARPVPLAVLHQELKALVQVEGFHLAEALSLVTSNVARGLKLADKGRIAAGCAADLLLLDPASLDVVAVMAEGRMVVRDGGLVETCELYV